MVIYPWKVEPSGFSITRMHSTTVAMQQMVGGSCFSERPPESCPNCEFIADKESVNSELKKEKVLDLTVKTEVRDWFEKFSNIFKIIIVLCWVLRFVDNTRKKLKPSSEVLDNLEKKEAENVLERMVQRKGFQRKIIPLENYS
ncbi:hypothetical protein AVEN_265196-1 [Araneus ventricosus]|uniref:Uncharacterized protein n=1 Tax=Araneus ventricosus TaxID=182803 RepID=A0A4Y2CNZ9_ARAVE|nr:hypothetical protein AVEN_265196-1 [Araneus ventricosus]